MNPEVAKGVVRPPKAPAAQEQPGPPWTPPADTLRATQPRPGEIPFVGPLLPGSPPEGEAANGARVGPEPPVATSEPLVPAQAAGRRAAPPVAFRRPAASAAAESLLIPYAGTTAAPTSDSLVWTSGLWSSGLELIPSHEAILYRLSRRHIAETTVEDGGLFSAAAQDRARTLETADDSLRTRLEFVSDSLARILPQGRQTRTGGQTWVTQQVSTRAGSGMVQLAEQKGDTPVEPPIYLNQGEYLKRLTASTFSDVWQSEVTRGLSSQLLTGTGKGTGHKIDIPVKLPSQFRGIFGEGVPNLQVRGSERISFGGTSRWNPNQAANEFMRKQSKFPQLDMKQDLNLQLTGSIGDKVSVDVDQSSQTTTPLANRIKIRYKGYDDDIMKSVDLGNTSLSLPGTQYVSYGGTAQGLFGINAQAKLGDIDLTSILTKQEGKSDSKTVSRTAETHTIQIDDNEYIGAKYFFLRDPDGCPWELDSLSVYLDDDLGDNNITQGAVPANATPFGTPSDTVYTGQFYRLTYGPDADYDIQRDMYTGHPVLILSTPLQDTYTLAVAYSGWELTGPSLQRGQRFRVGRAPIGPPIPGDTLSLKMIRMKRNDLTIGTNLRHGIWAPVANLELRNIYDLQARGILADGFEIHIRLKGTFGSTVNPDRIGDVTFLQMTGLDLSKDTNSGPQPGRDDRVDGPFISYENGLLHFPDLRPFDPDSSDLGLKAATCSGYGYRRFYPGGPGDNIYAPRPQPLPDSPDQARVYRAPAIYDSVSTRDGWAAESHYVIECTYKSPVNRISLNAFGILAGSEVVTAGGRTLVRDRDYRIDYDVGEVEILDAANVSENDQVNVTYSYVPFAGGGTQTTLAGVAAFYRPEDSPLSFSTSWLYESKGGLPGIEGKRPRLGQEPSRTVVGEFAANYKRDSNLLTSLVNAIPGVDARAPSHVDMAMGVGISLPNPNTKNQLYIDDFEGAKDVQSMSMNRRSWRASSIPLSPLLTGTADSVMARSRAHGELWWYSPRTAVQERDLQPTLDPQEGDNNRQVLRMKFFPAGSTQEERAQSWAGVTQVLSTRGVDLSQAQFLDVWINDFVRYDAWEADHGKRHGKLILDLGTVSEDAIWYRNDPRAGPRRVVAPNGKLDTEDRNNDGRLDLGGDLDEDTGMDQLKFGTPGADPFDVYHYDDNLAESDERKYSQVDGTEGNQDLDTEDLNGNAVLDKLSSYFQIAIDLADSSLWETDVYRDFVVRHPDSHVALAGDNGWRRIRIPLADTSLVKGFHSFGATPPGWDKIFHCRMWIMGFPDSTNINAPESNLLDVGGIEITGNRWYQNPIADVHDRPVPPADLGPGEDFFVGVVNNKDDAAIYVPPVGLDKQDNITEKEQSITLNLTRFAVGHRASIYRSYPQPQDYTLYKDMQFYLTRHLEAGDANLTCAIRLCKDTSIDTTNYYEYRLPAPSSWQLVNIDFATLSRLQLSIPDSVTGLVTQDLGGGVTISRRGSPSLTSVQRITFLVTNEGGNQLEQGSVWVDELRLDQVKRDTGLASRFAITANLSDLASLSFNLQKTGADFLKIGQDRGSGTDNTTWNLSGSTDLRRFGGGLGFDIPIRASLTSSRSIPKFRTNSDLILDKATDRDIVETGSQEYSLSISRRQSKSPWLRYFIDPFSVTGNLRRAVNLQPNSRDTTTTRSGSVNWNFPLDQWGDLPLTKTMKLRLLPTGLSASLSGTSQSGNRYSRTDLNRPYERQVNQDRASAALVLSASARPITPVTYRLDSGRDLMQQDGEMRLFGMHLGRETSRRHTLSASYDLPLFRQLLAPGVSWSGGSNLNLGQLATTIPGEPDRQNSFSNNQTAIGRGNLNLGKLMDAIRSIGGSGGGADSSGHGPPTPPPSRAPGPLSLGAINVSYNITTQTSFAGRTGEPSLLYQLALSEDPGAVRSWSRSTSSNTHQRGLNLDTSLRLPRQVSVTTRYAQSTGTNTANGLTSETTTRKWPDLDVNWGQLHRSLGLGGLFQSFQATTRFSREKRDTGSSTVSNSFSPLLNITAVFKSGMSGTLTSNASSSVDRPLGGRNENRSSRRQVTLALKKTLTVTRKVTIPVTNKVQTIQTKLNLNASVDWSKSRSETRTLGLPTTVSEDRSAWKFQTGMEYQFTQSFSGTGSINFGQDGDNKNNVNTARYIGLTFSASFTF